MSAVIAMEYVLKARDVLRSISSSKHSSVTLHHSCPKSRVAAEGIDARLLWNREL